MPLFLRTAGPRILIMNERIVLLDQIKRSTYFNILFPTQTSMLPWGGFRRGMQAVSPLVLLLMELVISCIQ